MNQIFSIRSLTTVLLTAALVLPVLNCSSSSKRAEEVRAREALKREVEFGRLIAFKVIRKYPILEDKKATLYVNKVGKAVAMYAGRSDIEYHFAILDTQSVNAFAAPGGYVFITRGAIESLRNEAELAGVLAHEIAHVNLKHILKELPPPRDTKGFVDRMAAVLSAQGTAISSAMSASAEKATQMLFQDGLKKQDEYEADQTAVEYTAATGYHPEGLPEFLEKLKALKGEKDNKSYSTHPSLTDRIAKLRAFIKAEGLENNKPILVERYKKNTRHVKNLKRPTVNKKQKKKPKAKKS